MKRFIAAAAIATTGLLVGAAGVGAYADPVEITIDPAVPAGGSTFTVTIEACEAGDMAEVVFPFGFEETPTFDVTIDSSGVGSLQLNAPPVPIAFTLAVFCDGFVVGTAPDASVQVQLGPVAATTTSQPVSSTLPATGSSNTGGTITIAALLLLAGGGMFAVTQVRRRQTTST